MDLEGKHSQNEKEGTSGSLGPREFVKTDSAKHLDQFRLVQSREPDHSHPKTRDQICLTSSCSLRSSQNLGGRWRVVQGSCIPASSTCLPSSCEAGGERWSSEAFWISCMTLPQNERISWFVSLCFPFTSRKRVPHPYRE